MSAGARYAWWTGGTDDPNLVAATVRAREELSLARDKLAGEGLVTGRAMAVSVVSSLLMLSGFAAALVVVPDPGHPLAILGALVAALLVAHVAYWIGALPPWPPRTPRDAPPPRYDDELRDLRRRLADVHARMDPEDDKDRRAAVERALLWTEDE